MQRYVHSPKELIPGFRKILPLSEFLSFVLKHFNHILVATHELATFIQHTSIDETAFLHDSSRCWISGEVVCPDVFKMFYLDAVVERQFQGFGADSLVPIRLSYPVAHLAVVFSDRDVAGFMGVVADATDSLACLFQHNRPCRVIMEECPDNLPTFFYRLMCRPSCTRSYVRV